jgi:hypothetical protein
MGRFYFLIWIYFGLCTINAQVELGKVNWLRDHDKAVEESNKTQKPIYILFQEIPGCATCVNFGKGAMSHPLIVEAIETYFVPLAIHNNKSGKDATILKKYGEPAWNNPVSRIIDSKGKDLVSRLSGAYDEAAVITYIRKGIEASKKLVPRYIQLLEEEHTALKKEIVVEMYCFWSGEKNIGNIHGVINTLPGYSNGKEVVKVTYDASAINAVDLVNQAKKSKNADAVHTNESTEKTLLKSNNIVVKNIQSFSLDKDVHYYLKNSRYAKLNLSDCQATKVNSLIGLGQNPDHLLSPRQLALLQKTK